MPPSPPSRVSESIDGATVVGDGYHLRPFPSPASIAMGKQPSGSTSYPIKPAPATIEEALPFVDERAYLDVKR